MKKFMLYAAGGTTIFTVGAIVGTVVAGRVLLPVIDPSKAAEQIAKGIEKTRDRTIRMVFGSETAEKGSSQSDHRYITNRFSRVHNGGSV